MKKIKFLVLSALCLSCVALGGCELLGKEEKTSVSLVDFKDETVEIEIGDIFSLQDYLKIYDEENTLYAASFELTDSKGQKVTLLANEFTVEDPVGYTLVLKARDPVTGEVVATRTLQLKTIDCSAPIIVIGDMVEYGVIGEKVKIPLMFDDANQTYTTSVTATRIIYSLGQDGYVESLGEEVTVEHVSQSSEASFTPTLQGKYKIVVEAWDGADKEAAKAAETYRAKEVYFNVKTSMGEIEGFDLPSSTVAAYGWNENCVLSDGSTKAMADKSLQNESAEWHETFEGREGVISMQPAKTDSYGGAYYIRSTTKTIDFYKFGTMIYQNTLWDYVSAWIYIEGEDGETVEVSGEYNFNSQTVPCNTWYEYRMGMEYFVYREWNRPWDTFSTRVNASWDNRTFLYVGEGTEADYTVYLDCFSYESGNAISVTATEQEDGTVKVEVIPNEAYETALENATYNYFVRAWGETEVWNEEKQIFETKVVDQTFTVTDDTLTPIWPYKTYSICVSVELDGVKYFTDLTCEVEVEAPPEMPENEIEGFYSANSVAAAYNLTHNVKNDTAEWHETFEGRNGVISMKPATTANGASYVGSANAGGGYYLKSTVRDANFYKFSGGVNNAEWDYISIWLYIPKPENSTATNVTVSAAYNMFEDEQVPFDSWYEYRLGKEYFVYRNLNFPYTMFAADESTNSRVKNVLFCVGDETNNDYTVYVDSFSYEKESEDLVTVTTTTNDDGTVTIGVTSKVDEFTLAREDYVCTARGYVSGTVDSKHFRSNDQLGTACKFTPNSHTSGTEVVHDIYYICVSFIYNGEKHFAFTTYEVPTATE